jgi:hypothetical protein
MKKLLLVLTLMLSSSFVTQGQPDEKDIDGIAHFPESDTPSPTNLLRQRQKNFVKMAQLEQREVDDSALQALLYAYAMTEPLITRTGEGFESACKACDLLQQAQKKASCAWLMANKEMLELIEARRVVLQEKVGRTF